MATAYDFIADTCAALAAKAKHPSDQVRMHQLGEQWRSLGADHPEVTRRTCVAIEPTASVRETTVDAETPRWSKKPLQPRAITAERRKPISVRSAAPAGSVKEVEQLANAARPHSAVRTDMKKSPIEEIKKLKAQLGSKTEQAKAEAIDKASEAIGVLRELAIDNDTILKELGFRSRSKTKESKKARRPRMRNSGNLLPAPG